MEVRDVDPGFSVAPQLQPADMAELAHRGFEAVICNRPDGEEPGQPTVAEMRDAAQAAGMAFHHIPVSGGAFPAPAVAAFAAVRRGTAGRTIAYCRSGTRSITLETLANPAGATADEVLWKAEAAGYDLSALRGAIE